MKKTIRNIALSLAIVVAGCTDLAELNVDPNRASPSNFDPNYFLATSQWDYVGSTMGYAGPILFQSGWAQILASTSSGGANYYSNMDKYVESSNTNNYLAQSWSGCYRSAALANEAFTLSEGKADLVNLNSIAKIMIILNIQYVTDLYGDSPYSEALKSKSGNTTPAYDTQETLYPLLLSDLDAAISALDVNKAGPTSDLIYNGNVSKWRKFGNSLMLRMAMRLIKAAPATAKTYAEKAATGGTFANAADDALIIPDNGNGYRNGNSGALITPADYYEVRWSKTFIDYLASNNDPRLGLIAEVPQNGLAANQNSTLSGNSNPGVQLGLPNGFDLNGGAKDISTSPGYPGGTGAGADFTPIGRYSRPKTSIYTNFNAPLYILTYAQTELLLAEAVVKGFSVGGTAAGHYKNGVVGAMLSLAPLGITISAGNADTYATANPLDVSTTDNSLKDINEQYWAACGTQMNFTEAWNNWKRSGYPTLTPVVFAGNFSGGAIPRRQPYPTNENALNKDSYTSAVGRLSGGDVWNARVWWDK
jgi:Starch-binding associating with outer membrane